VENLASGLTRLCCRTRDNGNLAKLGSCSSWLSCRFQEFCNKAGLLSKLPEVLNKDRDGIGQGGRKSSGDSYDWFFLAMAHWQLGEEEKARQWFDRAVQWMDKNTPKGSEFGHFRAEAAELLKVEPKND
jgi:hypothetical protein